jgi:hypothetical protein
MNKQSIQKILKELNSILKEQGTVRDVTDYAGQKSFQMGDYNDPKNADWPNDVFTSLDDNFKNIAAAKDACEKKGFQPWYTKYIYGSGNSKLGNGRYRCGGTKKSESTEPDVSPVPKEPTSTLSCKRCRGVGKGCRGVAVSEIQKKLLALGYKISPEEIVGFAFETDTEAAIKAFQASKKLSADGIVGRATCLALGLIRKPVKSVATPAGTGNSTINLQGQLGGPVQPDTVDSRLKRCADGSYAPENDVSKCPVPAEATARNRVSSLEEIRIREAGVLFNKLVRGL